MMDSVLYTLEVLVIGIFIGYLVGINEVVMRDKYKGIIEKWGSTMISFSALFVWRELRDPIEFYTMSDIDFMDGFVTAIIAIWILSSLPKLKTA